MTRNPIGPSRYRLLLLLLPISLPNSFDITQLPLGGFLPSGVLAAAKAFNVVFRS
ncbi:exported protein of unknown function [Candidatus Methylomirabilis oxygeniifera]|uniref:Uncharacterized protein n=1 Tax=Methylomirabilis oxygeniifera TaxID=671143 RepID=D5MER2_METO1|nr:exported protein of unknown function [Candidatus Methylomirabilis oxyfera]